MRSRSLATFAVLVLAATAFAAEPPQPAPDAETQIAFEVRAITVPADMPIPGCPAKQGEVVFLTGAQLQASLEAVQADGRANVLAAPNFVTCNGQEATFSTGELHSFVTGLETKKVNGVVVLVPKTTSVETGIVLNLCGMLSADKKTVATRVNYTEKRIDGKVEQLPVSYPITPVFEGGSQGKPIPFTQFLQAPQVETVAIDKKDLVIPCGGHAVIAGPAFAQEQKVEYKVPGLADVAVVGRMFRTVGVSTVKMRTILVVSPKVVESVPTAPVAVPPLAVPPLAAPMVVPPLVAPPVVAPPLARPAAAESIATVYRLRNAAAADVAHALTTHLARENRNVTVTAEPVYNSILVSGDPAVQQQIARLVEKIDAAPPQVVVQMLILKAPASFVGNLGIADEKDAGPTWVLTPRELRMFGLALREAKAREGIDILSRPQFQVSDNQTGTVQVGQESAGINARVTPRVSPDGKTVLLRADVQVSEPAPAPVNLGNGAATAAINRQSVQTTAVVPYDGAVLVRGARTKTADGVETELLILMTVHAVQPAK